MKIVKTPSQILITPAKPVKQINNQIKKIIDDMKLTLQSADHPKGVGLAAPQIGQNWRIFLIWPNHQESIRAFINPAYIQKSSTFTKSVPERDNPLEGCLSIPKIWGLVKRHHWVKIKYQNEQGKRIVEKFTGFPAVVIQHEMDHLDGVLFPKRAIEQKSKLYKTTTDEQGKEVLEPLEI